MKTIIYTVLALVMCSAQAAEEVVPTASVEDGPRDTAIAFMTQFYPTEPELVSVTFLKQTARQATVQAETPDGHACVFEMAPRPYSHAPVAKGWMIGSMNCKNKEQS